MAPTGGLPGGGSKEDLHHDDEGDAEDEEDAGHAPDAEGVFQGSEDDFVVGEHPDAEDGEEDDADHVKLRLAAHAVQLAVPEVEQRAQREKYHEPQPAGRNLEKECVDPWHRRIGDNRQQKQQSGEDDLPEHIFVVFLLCTHNSMLQI